MTEYVEVFTRCWPCRDTGIMPPDSEGGGTCVYCQGEGKLLYGHLDVTDLNDKLNDLEDKVNNVLDKCNDIFEKLNE